MAFLTLSSSIPISFQRTMICFLKLCLFVAFFMLCVCCLVFLKHFYFINFKYSTLRFALEEQSIRLNNNLSEHSEIYLKESILADEIIRIDCCFILCFNAVFCFKSSINYFFSLSHAIEVEKS